MALAKGEAVSWPRRATTGWCGCGTPAPASRWSSRAPPTRRRRFRPAGRIFAAAAAGGTLHLWRLGRGEAAISEMAPLATVGSDDGITALEFDPGRAVLAVVRSGSAELVDLTGIDAWAERACGRANRDLTVEEWNELIGENVPRRPVCPGSSADRRVD